jgi:uncharacterized FlgJ-related protein
MLVDYRTVTKLHVGRQHMFATATTIPKSSARREVNLAVEWLHIAERIRRAPNALRIANAVTEDAGGTYKHRDRPRGEAGP